MSDLLTELLTLCENRKRYLTVEIYLCLFYLFAQSENSSWNSKQKDTHFTKLNIFSEVIVHPAFV